MKANLSLGSFRKGAPLRLAAGALALAAALSAAPVQAAPQGLTPLQLSLSKNIYEAGEGVMLSLQATPGDFVVLLLDTRPGPVNIPGIGDLGVALSPSHLIVLAGVVPQSGVWIEKCGFDCGNMLTRVPAFIQALTIDVQARVFNGLSNTVTLRIANADCGDCPREAKSDPQVAQFGGGHAITLPGIGNDFEFISGGNFEERGDGTARLTGVIGSKSQPSRQLCVDIFLAMRLDPGDAGHAPAGSPKKELLPSAYIENGGIVAAETWRYYQTLTGLLKGMGSLAGAVIQVDRTGPAFQVGYGANGKNAGYGASGWLDVTILNQPHQGSIASTSHGDVNIDLGGDCPACPDAAEAQSGVGSNGGHVLWIPGIATDFVFLSGPYFVERAGGTAELTGVVASKTDGLKKFAIDIDFAKRMNSGNVQFPPIGSPKKELTSSSYIENGGLVDTDTWHYYEQTEGILTGLDTYAGGALKISRMGPAFQVGLGANGKNLHYGASGWFTVSILHHPDQGSCFPEDATSGDINIDLDRECPTPQ